MMGVLKLFESRREWRAWQPVAGLAVVSSFQGELDLVAEEFVKLAPRRHLAYRVVLASDFARASFEKQKAIIYLDAAPPEGGHSERSRAVCGERRHRAGSARDPGRTGLRPVAPVEIRHEHAIHSLGRGRVITPLDKWEDPFTLVRQVQLLLSIREDSVQVWNGGDMNSHYVATPDGRRAVVHLIPYASGNTQPVTIGVRERYRAARVITSASTTPVTITPGGLGFEIPVGEFSCFAAVELDI